MTLKRLRAALRKAPGVPGAGLVPGAGVPGGEKVHGPREMNRTERAYAEHLELRRRAGEVVWFMYEPCSLRLANHLHYRPDFLVLLAGGALELHEVKGFWRDDARAKVKMAAKAFPFDVLCVRKTGAGWEYERFVSEVAR